MNRYIIQPSSTQPNSWVLTDTTNGIVVTFEDGRFNETQQVTLLEDMPNPDVNTIARIMREMSEWAARHHRSKCLMQPYGFEYSEDDSKLYLYRRKHPRWRLMVEDDVNAASLASTLKKATEYLTKGIRP